MKKIILIIFTLIAVGILKDVNAFVFTDNFNDGTMNGWTSKQGTWTNPDDYLLSSYDNYGVAWKDGSFGYDQFIQVDAYFDDASNSKTAQLRLRSGEGGGGNSFFDHGYRSYIQHDSLGIYNTTGPGQHSILGQLSGLDFAQNAWSTIAFSVIGLGNETNLKLWVNDELYLNVFDTTGNQHDDGGFIGLGASNHLNRYIKYDNISSSVDVNVNEPSIIFLLSIGLAGFSVANVGKKKK